MFEAQGLLVKQGNRLKYVTLDGEEILEFRKGWTGDKLEIIMADTLARDNALLEVNTSEDESDEEQPEDLAEV